MSGIVDVVRSLAAFPGRARLAARMTVVVSCVMLAVLWLELPAMDIAAYVALFTCRRRAAETMRLGIVFAVIAPLAAVGAMALWGATTDVLMLRVVALAVVTFVAMYMKEVPGKGLAISSLCTLTVCFLVFASRAPDGDLLTRELLKAAFAVSIAGCVSAAAAAWLPGVDGAEESGVIERHDAPSSDMRRAFAVRATLATMLGYFLYELTDWFGIHTCMFTALFIAASDTDASLLRGRLRMLGAIGGSLAAICAIVFVVPGLDSVAGLIVLVAPITFVAAWITVGPARFAYLGLQVGLAFYLALLGRSGPTTNLHSARDRMVGVLLGVVLVALTFDGFRAPARREPAAT